ncbi:MAG: FG-GAP repeat protein [Deltaproteobacteria bacterium]|nr:FG-GAP repeat protein [Candidatus Tharpella aukensis]
MPRTGSDQAYAFFGYSVATAGDINHDGFDDVIVGAPWYDSGQADAGAAFVYQGSAGGLEKPAA